MRCSILAGVALTVVGLTLSPAWAALVYQNTFAGNAGTPDSTPGGGTLGITQGPGNAPGGSGNFNGVGVNGTSTGAYVSNNSYAFAGGSSVASTNAAGSPLAISALSKFTISFWIRTAGLPSDGTGTLAANQFGRVFVLGAAGSNDQGANAIGVEFRGGKLDLNVNGGTASTSQSQGATLAGGVWNFIAISYDGTSTAFGSSSQVAATGDARNAQLFEGTFGTPVTRYGVASAGVDGSSGTGPVALGVSSVLYLLNRNDLNRGTNASIDDFRIYDDILTSAQVEALRLSIPGTTVPEPTTLAVIAFAGVVARRRRA